MSRKNKNLRAFLHQNQNPTIEQAWDAAWKHAQKKFHARSMQDMEKQVAALQAENERLRKDAERWRALREMDGGEIYALLGDCDGIHPEQADAAFDQGRGKA